MSRADRSWFSFPRPAGTLAVFCLLAASLVSAQPRPEDQARRLFEDGRAEIAAGRARQGLDALQTIVTGFPASSFADDALLEIGRYVEEAENNPTKAREIYDQIAKKYPQSDSAPGAYFQMGRLALATAASAGALDEALTNFQRVIRLYPDSRFVPDALVASAGAFRRGSRYDAAIDAARRAVLDHPSSAAAPAAQFELALSLALAGDAAGALEEFQRVRSLYPDSAEATRALDAATALYRLRGGARPAFARDAPWTLAAGEVLKDVRAIAITPDGTTWIASNRTRSAVSYDASLQLGASVAAEDPQTLSVSPLGSVVFASRLAVKVGPTAVASFSVPAEKPGEMEPIERIGAATALVSGDTLVSDLKRKRVLRFRNGAFVNVFIDRTEREVVRLLTSARGEAVMLRKDDKSVEIADDSGRLLAKVGPRGAGFEWKKPTDIALDVFSNLYVADEDQGVFVLSPKGDLIAVFGAPDVKKAKALAIDAAGAVLVYDDRTETIVRFK